MDTASCRSCGADMIWTVTRSGKKMPMDAEPSSNGTFELHEMANGEVHAEFVPEKDRNADMDLYQSHFSTCPHANQHRK